MFFDKQNNPVNNVEIDIVCGYCDSSEIIFSDTNNCIYFEFLCDKIYFVNLYHIGLYTIKDIIRNPCDLEKKNIILKNETIFSLNKYVCISFI